MFIYFSVAFNAQQGFRFVLPFYLFFLAGIIWWKAKPSTLAIAGVWLVCSMIYNFPNYIGYFNEFVFQKEARWWHLNDSNISWLEDRVTWPAYKSAHAENAIQDYNFLIPIGTPFYIYSHVLGGIVWNRDEARWVRENLKPMDSFGGGARLGFLTKSSELLQKLPLESPFVPQGLAAEPCLRQAWWSVTDQRSLNLDPVQYFPQSSARILSGEIFLPEPGDVFFQFALEGRLRLLVDGRRVFESGDGGRRLEPALIHLPEGRHQLQIEQSRAALLGSRLNLLSEGAVSKRVLEEAPSVPVCVPPGVL
jgi:hypothetical protein